MRGRKNLFHMNKEVIMVLLDGNSLPLLEDPTHVTKPTGYNPLSPQKWTWKYGVSLMVDNCQRMNLAVDLQLEIGHVYVWKKN